MVNLERVLFVGLALLMIAFAIAFGVGMASLSGECQKRGGVLVRGAAGTYECVERR